MRSAVVALAWEFWAANRRGWLIVLAAVVGCALLFRMLADPLQKSEGLRFLCCLPMVMSMILAGAFCNFTDRERRDGIAGFPRHLFVLPLKTAFLVTCAMACGLVSVLAVYLAWATLVLLPLEIDVWVRWPATLIATCVVFYQAIIWCLCGFRLTRIVALSLVATTVLGVGFLPMLLPSTNVWSSQAVLTATLAGLAAAAYFATVVTVSVQRRGGGRGWTRAMPLVDRLAAALSYRRRALKTADAALCWIEWRRVGFVLPASVLLTTILILFLTIRFTDGGANATLWAETWLGVMPILLAVPIGMGFGKPDFWSLDLSLPTFVAARPVSGGQLLAAKMKAAAVSTLFAWTVLLLIAPLCIYLYLDSEHWHDAWEMSGILYSGFSRWALPMLAVVMAMLLTWSFLIGNVWLGYSGRPAFYYSFVSGRNGRATGGALFSRVVGGVSALTRQFHRERAALAAMAACGGSCGEGLGLGCLCFFFASPPVGFRTTDQPSSCASGSPATSCLMYCGWLLSPRIEWLRDTLLLVALCMIPAARLAATPLTIAWNRHR